MNNSIQILMMAIPLDTYEKVQKIKYFDWNVHFAQFAIAASNAFEYNYTVHICSSLSCAKPSLKGELPLLRM